MERFIDPRTLARVGDLPLVARTVADGFLHGIQSSHQRGVGIEFSQFRSYEPGDEPGRIDWKLYARSDRYFVREAERESEIAIWVVLDCSHSMAQVSDGGAWSKFTYARYLAATIAYLAQRQGDMVGFLSLGGEDTELLRPQTGERQWHRILKSLHSVAAGGTMPPITRVQTLLGQLQRPGLVVVISDLHQSSDEIHALLRRLSTRYNEVCCLQLQCHDELQFPWRGPTRFEDLETGEQVLVTGRDARAQYLQGLKSHQAQLGRSLALLGIGLDTVDIDQPMDAALYAFLTRRQRRLNS